MMFPDPADLAAARDAFLERQHRLWLSENRGRIEKLAAMLREAHALSRRIWPSAEDPVPAAVLNALYEAEAELED